VCRSRSRHSHGGINLPHETSHFEVELAAAIGVRHAIAVTSGSSALHTALAALHVGPGQEVIIPAFLSVSLASAVVNLGAIPVVADIDETFCLDPNDVARQITPRTTVIVMAH